MKKYILSIKNAASFLSFLLILVLVFNWVTDILIPKSQNRYYILEKYLEENPDEYMHEVQVFGSCHSYTSFDPVYFEEQTGISAFVYGNAGEIIPTTYARMVDQFKKHAPKVALVEIWGINPYETYSSHQRVFGFYLTNNLELTGLTSAKQEIIRDFSHMEYEDISFASMNMPLGNYKDRLTDGSLTEVDFTYSFAATKAYSTQYMFNEMTSRLYFNGFKQNPSVAIPDYPNRQRAIEDGEFKEIEPDIVKYIQKIIELCKEKDVELIFYRSPYIAKVNELKKLNHLRKICEENGLLFFDLEKEIEYSYLTDFYDYQHLSEAGAIKSTAFLIPYVQEALERKGIVSSRPEIQAPENLLYNSMFYEPINSNGQEIYRGRGETIDGWSTNYTGDVVMLTSAGVLNVNASEVKGWHLHQVVSGGEKYVGHMLTAVFYIADYKGQNLKAIISCRDGEDQEITSRSVNLDRGVIAISCLVPQGTEDIRVGFFAKEGIESGEYVLVRSAILFDGFHSIDYLSRSLSTASFPQQKEALQGAPRYLRSFAELYEKNGRLSYHGKGHTIDGWKTNFSGDLVELTGVGIRNTIDSNEIGWHLYKTIEDAGKYVGTVITAVFDISDYGGDHLKLLISCRNAEDQEIVAQSVFLERGIVSVSCYVPERTEYIRYGFFSYDGVAEGDYVLVRAAAMDDGSYSIYDLRELMQNGS